MNSKSLVGYSKPGITKIYTPATQSSARSGHGKVDPPIVQLVEFRPKRDRVVTHLWLIDVSTSGFLF